MESTQPIKLIACVGCSGEFEIDSTDDQLGRFCSNSCKITFYTRLKALQARQGSVRVSPSRQGQSKYCHAYNSPLGQLAELYNSKICTICLMLGGLSYKSTNRAFCSNHISQPPKHFKCKNCKQTYSTQVECCNQTTSPKWQFNPNFPEFLKGKPKLPKYIIAQMVQANGKVIAFDILDKVGELLNIGNSTSILEMTRTTRSIEKLDIGLIETGIEQNCSQSDFQAQSGTETHPGDESLTQVDSER